MADHDVEQSRREAYNARVEQFRGSEYPMLRGTVYLDHAGTTLYSKSLMERFSADMMSSLYGNPHSSSVASQNTSKRVEDARLRLLGMFRASPDDFDIVFVANATAGIKLVMDSFRDAEKGFQYLYHGDAHTSLVGVREVAKEHAFLARDEDVEAWLDHGPQTSSSVSRQLFAYPAQSNMNGRRLPMAWCERARRRGAYTLLDAASYVSTSPLDFSNVNAAPDFTVMSLYKIFGFPDLGALILRKASADVFQSRRYFGGGTVDLVSCSKEPWHSRKSESLHDQLEDGTLPIHSIVALQSAMDVHQELFRSLHSVSDHCRYLAEQLHDRLFALRHANGSPVCEIYKGHGSDYSDACSQGPIVALNIRNMRGGWVSSYEVEKLAAVRNIHIRTGGLCNPGGVASYLKLEPWEIKANFSAGFRCGKEGDVVHGKPTGMLRLSLGAMSTLQDVNDFVDFMQEFFVENYLPVAESQPSSQGIDDRWYVESLTVYPIKSCAGYSVPPETRWLVRPEGLAWDREWCLVRPGTRSALSQKRYPQMALIRPEIDTELGIMRVSFADKSRDIRRISIPLSDDPARYAHDFEAKATRVCEDSIIARIYQSEAITDFFTQALGVACQLARFPAGNGSLSSGSTRHAKAHLQRTQRREQALQLPGTFPDELMSPSRPMLLSNESPILVISRSSINRLNEEIKNGGGKAVHAEAFRANIVVAERYHRGQAPFEEPYMEDEWELVRISGQYFQMLGSCRRCQMVCIDQETGVRQREPFSTLAKTRRMDGKVWFGQHACLLPSSVETSVEAQTANVAVGERVQPYMDGECLTELLTRSQSLCSS